MPPLAAGPPFGERYALETIEGGGVLVDLGSGAYFSLNATASRVCSALYTSPNEAAAAAALAAAMSLSAEQSLHLIHTVAAALEQDGTRHEPIGPFRYLPADDGYVLTHAARPALRIERGGAWLELVADPAALTFPLIEYVRAVVPKLLFLGGTAIVHGAACELDGALTAFCGISGAGKTTTARAFGAAGARVVSEDLLLIDSASDDVSVFTNGEREAHGWAARAAAALARGAGTRVACDDLLEAASGPTLPVSRLWFMDEHRRKGTAFVTRRLGPAEGFVPLMSATFLGASDGPGWKRYLRANRAIAERVAMWEVWAPAGAEVLAEAARSALASLASRS